MLLRNCSLTHQVAKRNAAEQLLIELGYAPSSQGNAKPQMKSEKESESNMMHGNMDKNRKVTFVEENQEQQPSQSVGGSGGRQLVPGVLLVTEQTAGFQKQKENHEKPLQNQAPQLKPPATMQGVRSKDKLLYLAQIMNIQVSFSDFPKANHEMFLTLVSLSTNPPQVCHGEGPTTEASHEKASQEALKVLSELGLDIAQNREGAGGQQDRYISSN